MLSGTTTQFVTYLGTGTAVQAVANTGYAFSGWSDGSIQNPRIYGSITNNLLLT